MPQKYTSKRNSVARNGIAPPKMRVPVGMEVK